MMNSETSISSTRKRQTPSAGRRAGTAAPAGKGRPASAAPAASATGGLRPSHLLIIGTFGAASAAASVAHGTRPANIVFVVLAVLVTGISSVALYRTLAPLASDFGSSQPEMLGGRTRAALEREKTIVLRAIKELEFDRAMGKVSEADCEEMIGRLRKRAVRVIRELDAGSAGYRELHRARAERQAGRARGHHAQWRRAGTCGRRRGSRGTGRTPLIGRRG